MADYPDVITELPLVEGRNLALGILGDVVKSEDTNKHFRETEAIEAELGTNPKGADADVKARLDRIQSEIVAPPVTKIIAGDNITIDPVTGLGDVTITGAAAAAGGAPTFQKVIATDGTGDLNCDGTDDQVEIQQAINDVSALGGGTVFLRAGVYNISASINLLDNVNLLGGGDATVIYSNTGDFHSINVNTGISAGNISCIYNLQISRDSGVNLGAVYGSGLGSLRISNCKIASVGHGVELNSDTGTLYFLSNRITVLSHAVLKNPAGGTYETWKTVVSGNNIVVTSASGIGIASSQYLNFIENNRVFYHTNYGGTGISLLKGYNSIRGNMLRWFGTGITCLSPTSSIIGNVFMNCNVEVNGTFVPVVLADTNVVFG